MKFTDIYKKTITVARIFGIPVRFDYRWFVVFILSVWLIAANLGRGGMWVGSYKMVPLDVPTPGPGDATTMAVLSAIMRRLNARVFGDSITVRSTLAAYPWCGNQPLDPDVGGTEVRVLIGDRDNWVSPSRPGTKSGSGTSAWRAIRSCRHSRSR